MKSLKDKGNIAKWILSTLIVIAVASIVRYVRIHAPTFAENYPLIVDSILLGISVIVTVSFFIFAVIITKILVFDKMDG